MPVSSMKTIPYSDPGMLQGGVREHRAILNNLQADAFRSASQKASIPRPAFMAGRARGFFAASPRGMKWPLYTYAVLSPVDLGN